MLAPVEYELFRAAKDGSVAAVQDAIARGARVDARGPERETPIMVASFHGHSLVARVLASLGADVNKLDKYRGSALHLAAFQGHRDCVLTLLALKADPCLRNGKNQAPWQVATREDIASVLKTFRPFAGRTLMHYACEHGSLPLVQWIIAGRFGNAVVAWDSSGVAPLHVAAEKGHLAICEALLLAGADKHIYNSAKKQPADLATREDVRKLISDFEPHRVRFAPASQPAPANTTTTVANANDDDDDTSDSSDDRAPASSRPQPIIKKLAALGEPMPRVGTPDFAHVASTAAAAAAERDPFDEFVSARLVRKGSQTDSPARQESPGPGGELISFDTMYSSYADATYAASSTADKSTARLVHRGSWSPTTAPTFDPFSSSSAAPASPVLAPRQPAAVVVAAPAITAIPNKAVAALKQPNPKRASWSPFDTPPQ